MTRSAPAIHVCCGVGGTGKTTTAAALAVGLAYRGQRVVVLTIDPARRLADALGLDALGNQPNRVALPDAPGELHALMLDRKATFDQVIRRFAGDGDRSERILENRYYRAVSTRLTGSHEYMALEKLHQLVSDGGWDAIVVDTPPARHVLDFFEAPARVQHVFDRSMIGGLIQPGDGFFSGAGNAAMGVIQRLAGDRVVADISEFFTLVQDIGPGIRARSAEVARFLASDQTRYWLVASADAPERNDLAGFLATLRSRSMVLGGFLINRCTAEPPAEMPADWPNLPVDDDAAWRDALGRLLRDERRRYASQWAAAHRLSVRGGGAPVWMVPDLADELRTTAGLERLSRSLPPNPASLVGRH